MVIARGIEGDVGILAGHAPMLIRLAISPLRVQHAGDEERLVVDGGFLHVTSEGELTRVDVLASHATKENEIDPDVERRRQLEMERRLEADHDEGARAELAKALARIELRA